MDTHSTTSRLGTGLLRFFAGIVGAAVCVGITYATVKAIGGIEADMAPLIIVHAVALVVGAMCVGVACRDRRWVVASGLVLMLLAGEAYTLINTSERELEAREAKQAPVRAAMVERERLQKAVTSTPRLEAALTELTKVRDGARKTIAEASCVKLCKDTLDKQEAKAEREVQDARAEAQATVQAANAALAAIPAVAAVSPLAARINVADWKLDLTRAGLLTLSANGLVFFLMVFAAHGGRRESVASVQSVSTVSAPTALTFERPLTEKEIEEIKELDKEIRQVLAALVSSGRPLNNNELKEMIGCEKSEASKRSRKAYAEGLINRWQQGKFVYSEPTEEGRKLLSLVA